MTDHKIKGRRIYYKEKVLKLNQKLAFELGDARSRICNCESYIEAALMASSGTDLGVDIERQWSAIWDELTSNPNAYYFTKSGDMIGSPVCGTIKNKRNKTMLKYLMFFNEELFRVLDPKYLD